MSESSSKDGSNLLGLLGIVFVTLKLCGVIDWSWWWVTAPFWGGLALALLIMLVALICTLVAAAISEAKFKKIRKDLAKKWRA